MILNYTAEQIGIQLREMLERQIEDMVTSGLTLRADDNFSLTLRLGPPQSVPEEHRQTQDPEHGCVACKTPLASCDHGMAEVGQRCCMNCVGTLTHDRAHDPQP